MKVKILKYILFLLFVLLGLFQTKLEAKNIILEDEKIEILSEQDFKDTPEEKEWLGLLYLQKESTNLNQNSLLQFSSESLHQNFSGDLCLKSIAENLESSFQVGENLASHRGGCGGAESELVRNPKLTKAWKRLNDLGVDDALRKNPEILSKVDDLYNTSKFQLPGNRPVVNGKKLDGDFTVKTRDGKHDIYFDKNGFPDFEDFSLGKDFSFKPDGKVLNGSSSDFSKATDWLKNKYADNPNIEVYDNGSNFDVIVNGKLDTYTWHHHQDGKTLMPVLTSVHSNVAHTGGAATIKRGLEGIFQSPY